MVEHIAHEFVVLVQGHCVMIWMGEMVCFVKGLRVRRLLLRAHSTSAGVHKSSPSQVPTVLLTIALIVLWLSLHGGDLYTNRLLKDVTVFFCID